MANACGLDFGTSNSTVGWRQPDAASASASGSASTSVSTSVSTLLPLEDGKVTLPSVVFFNAEDDSTSFGRAALSNYLAGYEGRLMRSLKSLLGTRLIDGQTEVHGRALPYRGLLAQFIAELKRRAEQAAGRGFASAVIGRPVFFIDGDPKADQLAEDTLAEIARAAGFHDIAFQYEPIAAAFDYESQIDREELVLVADIGGGTSDFSLIRLSPERARQSDRRTDILANGGVHIGGTDFDKYLSLSSVMPLLGLGSRMKSHSGNTEVPSSYYFNLATWHTINQAYTQRTWLELKDIYRDAGERGKLDLLMSLIEQRAGHWLALRVEEAKIALSDSAQIDMPLERLSPDLRLGADRTQFDVATARLTASVETTVSALLTDAGVAPNQVDTVFFTGGSSGIPALRSKIGALLPAARRVEGDLFGSIGAGLAIDAQRKFG